MNYLAKLSLIVCVALCVPGASIHAADGPAVQYVQTTWYTGQALERIHAVTGIDKKTIQGALQGVTTQELIDHIISIIQKIDHLEQVVAAQQVSADEQINIMHDSKQAELDFLYQELKDMLQRVAPDISWGDSAKGHMTFKVLVALAVAAATGYDLFKDVWGDDLVSQDSSLIRESMRKLASDEVLNNQLLGVFIVLTAFFTTDHLLRGQYSFLGRGWAQSKRGVRWMKNRTVLGCKSAWNKAKEYAYIIVPGSTLVLSLLGYKFVGMQGLHAFLRIVRGSGSSG